MTTLAPLVKLIIRNNMTQRKNKRTPISKSVETQVLVASRRRCCLCYFLNNVKTVQKGQIAHLNRDASNSDFSNLVYLCLNHHDDYDSRPSQTKGYTVSEVEEYRNRLYAGLGTLDLRELLEPQHEISSTPQSTTSIAHVIEQANGHLDFIHERWRLMWPEDEHPDLFAYKSPNRFDGVCRIERINLPDGRVVIICEEIDDNPGRSVTNTVEYIALQVCEQLKIDPQNLVWIEHYDTYFADEEEWNLVTFDRVPPESNFKGPKWTPLTEDDWRSFGFRPRRRRTRRKARPTSNMIWYRRRT